MIKWFVVGSFVIFLGSCLNPPDYSVIPEIEFDSISSTFIKAGQDSVTFFIAFTDGDGDLGSEETPNLFLLDNRTGYPDSVKVPHLTPEGNVKAISGIIAYTRSSFNCIPGKASDTVYYSIYMEDRAGNKSNVIITPSIVMECP